MVKKLYIKTNGCQMNEYDSSKMAEVLYASHGLVKTDQVEDADVILLNTCSIREKAQEKVFSQLGQWREYKAKNPHVLIGVGGCVASQEGSDIIKRAPFVDIVFGPQTLHRLPALLNERLEKNKSVVDISFPEIEKFDHLPAPRAEGPTAFVSIMEGCSKYCSFCVVPYTRGEEISRPFDDVLAECYQLASQGVREINLLGQNVNDYRGIMDNGDIADLALLIHYIAAIDGIGRIRFTTSHPLAFSENLINAYAEVPELANHLHLPVQSGSDRILSLMKRGYTALEFKSKIRKLRKIRPDIRLSTDIIVGFPGETDKDFQDTMDLVHEIGFDTSFSFIYSPRPGTPAANLPDDTPMEVKKQRLQILQNRLLMNAARYSESMIGSKQKILVTGFSKKSSQQLSGRTECNRVVNFDGPPHLIGQFIDVQISDALPNSLRGRLLEKEMQPA
ncbi:TPA: tRNA (N6-isopentenyl adenosine(37)-C2)-methylthiotransferase MiaB [Legionella pneumophila subsp. pneumophila]|uniref:tRNA (N6-isopentenyl adenosine(37)-C2)-methylthiotransferase MiaB n=1 Tax=Legionella pneumophila TaxID=446 RepID=UPI00057616A5|nr:tRNA (N6-isopentenyl adenosine(37)-C2)-methylthiotransferase MiaB [Legionella pneumophila]MDC8028861.1 tRNA (N6-isopentenyl adenosine(37)-C2)-methylthiotransferase MiaB [Legionella pneumophila subsp. pneumophila]MDW8869355.1 tRNA (N6-isopentenyl adenosine(37)-C2)-methylthiotransferase MiaB [Legionella pneumophila]MDW8915365.1 tRNA (N6-isopentenyl adenosine(37)-C2)-methylthiotransferase MiaB [Legionella pneumophila]MDW8923698.1 tRNA (N6-isopentenyl adenosine(37)-C2)-methylthiotransferase MiaB